MSEVTNKVVVTLKIGVDVDAFIEEMSNVGNVSPHVPNRAVEIFNLKEDSLRNVDFTMTYTEMEELRKDQRVLGCRWGTKKENGIEFAPCKVDRIKTYNRNGTDNNWGIIDCVNDGNPFITDQINSSYNYNLDGTDVDVVIMDTGLNCEHDEFKDSNGVSRVKKIDWWIEAGFSEGSRPWTADPIHINMPTGFYADVDGHGTHVASTAAGLNVGWAKNANIYVMKISTVGSGIGSLGTDMSFNLIRAWHQNKPINSKTGRKNPTIVNMSWSGFPTSKLNFISSSPEDFIIKYRGVTTTVYGVSLSNYSNLLTTPYGVFINGKGYPTTSLSTDANLLDAMINGVIFVGAAANDSHAIDQYSTNSLADFNNYISSVNGVNEWTRNQNYYHRGPTPGSVQLYPENFLNPTIDRTHIGVICVGATEVPIQNGATGYYKASFSNCGPRIDIYAPGVSIYGADNDNNSGYTYLAGTSMASPQVCGVLACVLQANPYFTQEDAIQWLKQHCNTTKMTDHTGDGTWDDLTDVQGSQLRYLNMPYRSNNSGRMTSN
jgi:subtilisin family serine protease